MRIILTSEELGLVVAQLKRPVSISKRLRDFGHAVYISATDGHLEAKGFGPFVTRFVCAQSSLRYKLGATIMANCASVRRILTLAATLTLTACIPHGPTRNVRPGDVDYPAQNLSPTETVDLKIIDPPSIKIEVMIGYEAQSLGGAPNSGNECFYTIGTGPSQPYSVLTPLPLTRSGNLLSGKIVVDGYQPGRCGYAFAGVYYRYLPFDENQDSNHELIFLNSEKARPDVYVRADVWCFGATSRMACLWLDSWPLEKDSPISKADVEDIVSRGGGNKIPVFIGLSTKTVLIQFHDIASSDGGRTSLYAQ